ncbi:MAG: hypothetical protein ACNA8W_05955 [Bradymonadaceae bacterium]
MGKKVKVIVHVEEPYDIFSVEMDMDMIPRVNDSVCARDLVDLAHEESTHTAPRENARFRIYDIIWTNMGCEAETECMLMCEYEGRGAFYPAPPGRVGVTGRHLKLVPTPDEE